MDIGTSSFLAFVLLMAGIIYFKRHQLEIHGPIAMTRTGRFRKEIISLATKYRGFWKAYFSLGIIVAMITLVLGTILVGASTVDILSGSGNSAFGLVIPYPTSELSFGSGIVKTPIWLWVFAIAILIIPHEFSHGLALAMNKLRIKSLGMMALLVIPGAFVEPDEAQLKKARRLHRIQVYCAGSFSNIVVGVLLIGLLYAFVGAFYAPAGVYFSLPVERLNTSEIVQVNNLSNGFLELMTQNSSYLTLDEIWPKQKEMAEIVVLSDLPAARNNISGALESIGGYPTKSREEVSMALSNFSPGNMVEVVTSTNIYNVTLDEREGKAYLGILMSEGGILSKISPMNEKYYEPKNAGFGGIGQFILELLGFTIAVCIGVAVFNMLPMKPLDGGLVVEALTNAAVAKASSLIVLAALLVNFGAALFW
ncbi:MAG: site-2 protease family protein [Candidatus Aenigmatarchaeota archaeon]